MAPGVTSGIITVLRLPSDKECIEFLFDLEQTVRATLDELRPLVEGYAASEQLGTNEDASE